MINLQRPLIPVQDVFTTCISGIRAQGLKQRLIDVTQDIVDASNDFDTKAAQNCLHQIAQTPMVGNLVTKDEMVDVYENKMARKGEPGRLVYDQLILSPPQAICPLCAHREVTTLDHHLPKARYPALAITPLNLVPACWECNTSKKFQLPTTASQETLHPYYDNIGGVRWLYADVLEDDPASLHFFVRAPESWTVVLTKRVEHHFRTFELAELYSTLAAGRLRTIRNYLLNLYKAGGSTLVHQHMVGLANSASVNGQNSWEAVALEALAANDWFCNGGFK